MFDCLQEGIVVIEEKPQEKDFSVLFCNDMANRITSKILNMKIIDKKFDSRLLNAPVLFEYKTIRQK